MAPKFRAGDVVAHKYRVERVLGEGGMGIVLEATQLELERRVALKFLTWGEGDQDAVARGRFEREARVAAKLQSIHAAKVLDVGKLDDGVPFMVLEFLEGEDLDSYQERVGRLPVADAVDFVLQACEAMAEAHSFGIIHRDLKPANLFLTRYPDGRPLVKVLDFGISKVEAETEAGLTQTGGAIGTPQYMSPEQLGSSKHVTARTDIWALGAILYELVTARAAFGGDSVAHVHANILREAPVPVRSIRAEVSPGLDAVISRCLQKDPLRRPASIAELASELAPFGTAQGVASAAAAARIVVQAHGAPTPPVPLVRRPDGEPGEPLAAVARSRVDPGGETFKSVSHFPRRDTEAPVDRRLVLWGFAALAVVLVSVGFTVRTLSTGAAAPAVASDLPAVRETPVAASTTPSPPSVPAANPVSAAEVAPAPVPTAVPVLRENPAPMAPAPAKRALVRPKATAAAPAPAPRPASAAPPEDMLLHRR